MEIDGQLTPVNFPGLPRLTPFQTEMIAMHMLRSDREATRTLRERFLGPVDLRLALYADPYAPDSRGPMKDRAVLAAINGRSHCR